MEIYVPDTAPAENCFAGWRDEVAGLGSAVECYSGNGNIKAFVIVDSTTSGNGAIGTTTTMYNQKVHYVFESTPSATKLDVNQEYNYTSALVHSRRSYEPWYLFAYNRFGSPDYKFTGRVYSAKFYKEGILIGDFIPVERTSDSEVCLYDKVTNAFFTNQGTGTFVAGPTVS